MKWIVQDLDGDNADDYEVSVIHSSFKQGLDSHGWDGPNKICMPTDGYSRKECIKRAKIIAKALNNSNIPYIS